MAITIFSEEETFTLAIAYLSKQFSTRSLGPKSFLGQQARALAQLVGAIQQAVQDADSDGVPAYATIDGIIRSRCSSQALENWAFVYGLPSNRGPGQFGRNEAQAAQGGVISIQGVPGTHLLAGSQLTDPSGTIVLKLIALVTIGPGATAVGNVAAVTPGASGNLPAQLLLRWQAPPAGVTPTCLLRSGLSGGLDEEDDLALLDRLIRRLQSPPKGGTASDIRSWAEQAQDISGQLIGIKRAYVYPHRNGVGSYDVVIDLGGVGAARIPSTAQQAQVQAYLDSMRVVTDTARVMLPRVVSGKALRIWLSGTPTPKYQFDWQDGGNPETVESATSTTLVVKAGLLPIGFPPDSLVQAIDAYLNQRSSQAPRIQMIFPAVSPVPFQVQVLKYEANQPVAGKYTLTITPLPNKWVTSPGTIFFAGGTAVPLVAQKVLNYLGQVGPSRSSGYADELDLWEDSVTIGNLARAALDTVDDEGVPILLKSAKVGEGTGVQIAVGSGLFKGSDFLLYDSSPDQGPEIPDCSHIYVTGN